MATTINGIPINGAVGTNGVDSDKIDFQQDKLFIGGTAVVATAAELNGIAMQDKISWSTDFLGDLLPDEIAIKAGSGTGNAVALGTGHGGILDITTASDDGAITANASAVELAGLDFVASNGGLEMEVRVAIDDVSEAYIFIGFTDASQASTLEEPLFLTTTAIDSTATDAVGVLYDVDGTTKQWLHGGTKNGTDTTPAYSGAAPTEGAYEVVKVTVDADGAVQGFIDGVAIGAPVANAVTTSVALLPIIVVANRSANAVIATVDYIRVQANR